MAKPVCILLICLAFCNTLLGQQVLKGRIVSADTRKPIAHANVFLSNSSVGTITNENGEFTIPGFPQGRYDLVVSYIGYESYVLSVQSNKLPAALEILLKPKVNELKEVIVEAYEKDGWSKWGQFFMENFIGSFDFAGNCKLLNKEAVNFRFSKKANTLKVVADDRLVLENQALGYILKYDLTRFEFDFNTRILVYQGYPLFEEMETSREGVRRRWLENREDAYYGSIMHFMRSLYRNRLLEEQFEVRKLIKIPDAEKKRVKEIYQAQIKKNMLTGHVFKADKNTETGGNADSSDYYRKVLQQPEKFNILINSLLPGDSIAYGIDSTTAGLEFSDHLQVIYLPKKTPVAYQKYLPNGVGRIPQTSELSLAPGSRLVSILSSGSYFEGTDLISSGYWAWSEKIASMLPSDYRPRPKNK